MVFHCRCFSFLLEETEYETRTRTKSSATETFYTAPSDFNRSVPNSQAKSSEISNLTEKQRSNLRVFTIADLKAATENFCSASKIGVGEFASVYKGVIKSLEHPFDEIQVAVKRDDRSLQGRKEWETEINVLGTAEHPNLVKLIGYCAENNERRTNLLLVYEYMANGSVRDHLSAKSETHLSWTMRLKVAQDVAHGLKYLHEETDFQIILRDFKPSNILLDDKWNAKLSDFGVSQILGTDVGYVSHISTKVAGSAEYTAPEYFVVGNLTSKSDVWSYGVFLYELITGRRPLDWNRPESEQKLLEWVKPYVGSKRFQEIVDPRLEGNYPLESAQKLSIIANKCLSENPKSRPNMSEVHEMVSQLIVVPQVAVNQDKAFVGPTQCKKTNEDTKHEGQKGSMKIQLKKPACLPEIRPLKLLNLVLKSVVVYRCIKINPSIAF